ncbi:response regulator transcription factor [Neptunicella sp.]|uniref:response regulator transcription factor n=1 Tax=Neptunicella sp. TaxID=2125986 RepID=UPI003F68DB6C
MIAVVDDDEVYASALMRRLQRHDLAACYFTHPEPLLLTHQAYSHLLLDLNLGSESMLQYIPAIRRHYPDSKIWIVTGYASIATTVNAIKLGADDYLTKPLDFKGLLAKIDDQQIEDNELSPLSSAQLEWEHIQRVLQENNGNISVAARVLNMHRRTLQRKLQKKPIW